MYVTNRKYSIEKLPEATLGGGMYLPAETSESTATMVLDYVNSLL